MATYAIAYVIVHMRMRTLKTALFPLIADQRASNEVRPFVFWVKTMHTNNSARILTHLLYS